MQKGSVNKVILVGHLGGDPESRYASTGNAVTTFNVATNETRKNPDGGYDDNTEWHRIVFFGKLAETANEYLKKGQLIYIDGKLRTRSWEDNNGVKRYTTEVVGERFTMLGRRLENKGSVENTKKDDEDDLPF